MTLQRCLLTKNNSYKKDYIPILTIMRKNIAIKKGFIRGETKIDYVNKTLVSRTPGNVTEELGHN
jgi:hypothetical protein